MTQLKMTLPVVTIEDIRSWHPCKDPVTYFGLPEYWRGDALDLLEAKGDEELGHEDRMWGVLRIEMLPEPLLSQVVVAIVREAPLADGRTVGELLTDSRSHAALDARLKWSQGEITDEQLYAASVDARAATWDAAPAEWHAAWATTWAAAWANEWDAARAAVRTAEPDAEAAAQAAQIKIANRVIQEAVK